MTSKLRRSAIFCLPVAAAVALLWFGDATAIGLAVPVLLLVFPLLCGRFVGERSIAKLARRARGSRRRPVTGLLSARATSGAVVAWRGGRLIAASLAERGPPALRAV